MSSDWSDTMVWFGQILLYLYFYPPIYMILAYTRVLVLKHIMNDIYQEKKMRKKIDALGSWQF